MNRWELDALEAIAVLERDPPSNPWRMLDPVFRVRGAPEAVVWPEWIDDKKGVVFGMSTPVGVLEERIAAGEVREIHPIAASRGGGLVREDAETFRWRSLREVQRARREACMERLGTALDMAGASGEEASEAVDAAFEAAWVVDPWDHLPNVLRVGWAALSGNLHGEDTECLRDAIRAGLDERSVEIVRVRPEWRHLPQAELRDILIEKALAAIARHLAPDGELHKPADARAELRAAAFAALRARWGAVAPVRIRTGLIPRILQGDPDALSQVEPLLDELPDWRAQEEKLERDPNTFRAGLLGGADGARFIGQARLTDLRAAAATIYTLELNAKQLDRKGAWQRYVLLPARWNAACRNATPWMRGRDLAHQVREGLDIADLPLRDLEVWVENRFGILVDAVRIADSSQFAATIVPSRAPPCIFLDVGARRDPLVRRFSVAHALAHLLVDRPEPGSEKAWFCLSNPEVAARDANEDEQFARAFAAYLLAPPEAVRKLTSPDTLDNLDQFCRYSLAVSDEFGMSPVAAAEHYLNCHGDGSKREPVPEEIRQAVREAAKTFPRHMDWSAPADEYELDGDARRGVRFRALIRECVSQAALDEVDAAKLLGIDKLDFDSLPSLEDLS